MINDEARALKAARAVAAAAYLLGGGLVAAVAYLLHTPTAGSVTLTAATALSFVTVSSVAKRLRHIIPDRVALQPPTWRELWPNGFVTAPLFTSTAVLGLYATVSSATSLMATHLSAAAVSASTAIAALTLHALVPEVAIRRRRIDLDEPHNYVDG